MKNKNTRFTLTSWLFATAIFFAGCSKTADVAIVPVIPPPTVVVTVPATVASITPATGAADTEVTIIGQDFGTNPSAIKVTFGSKNATLISLTDTQIKVKVPYGAGVGKVDVSVNVANTTSNKLDFNTQPLITDLTATSFYNGTVIINGSDFSANVADNVVKFGTVQATVVAATTTYLRVLAPDLGVATTASVTVTSAGFTSAAKPIAVEVDQNKVATFNWTTNTVKSGITYKSGQFTLFGATQRKIYVLDITLNEANTLGIGFSTNNAATTTMCNNYGAVGGVNAGYFPLSGATDKDPYIRINGATIQNGNLDVSPIFTNAALVINKNVASIVKFTANNNNLNLIAAALPVIEAENVLVCGPILITGNQIEDQNLASTHNTSSAARTGIGVSADGKRVFMVVVDTGAGSTGVTTPQLAKILQALGAVDAMNLDGGGSSTMFVKNQGNNGLVNLPSGSTTQRAVRSIVYVK